jgi:hypothetical protein
MQLCRPEHNARSSLRHKQLACCTHRVLSCLVILLNDAVHAHVWCQQHVVAWRDHMEEVELVPLLVQVLDCPLAGLLRRLRQREYGSIDIDDADDAASRTNPVHTSPRNFSNVCPYIVRPVRIQQAAADAHCTETQATQHQASTPRTAESSTAIRTLRAGRPSMTQTTTR